MNTATVIGALLLLSFAGTAGAQTTPAVSNHCTQLVGGYDGLTDAPAQVTAAVRLEASGGLPAFCRVQGYVAPNVGFELRMPNAWNGKYFQVGCGGFCGVLFDCNAALRRGYACLASDMGHRSSATDAKWALNNLQAEVDWGFRATHTAALAGKALTAAYYRRPISRSYFMGGTTGGREALILAQHFPWDFDGIIAGYPPIAPMQVGLTLAWNGLVLMGTGDAPVLSEADLTIVHAAVLAACDMDDGVRDAIVSDPLACAFEPRQLLCRDGKTARCLSAVQVDAVRRIYQGPVNSKGEMVTAGGALKGSELAWFEGYSRSATHDHYYRMGEEALRYLAFFPDAGHGFTAHDIDWDVDPQRLGVAARLYDATNPDLRRFKAAGGKLILWQGWADQSVSPEASIDYYQMVERVMGGRKATQDFFRLFLLPGVHHGIVYTGASAVDYISYLEAWVETDAAPDRLIGARVKTGSQSGVTFPLDPANVAFTRPFYPYPMMARYRGSGDPNDAASFGPAPLRGTYDSSTGRSRVRD